jgi:hypothetical protein
MKEGDPAILNHLLSHQLPIWPIRKTIFPVKRNSYGKREYKEQLTLTRSDCMTTTGELLSIIEKLELVDVGEATSYVDEGDAMCGAENYENGYVDNLSSVPAEQQGQEMV